MSFLPVYGAVSQDPGYPFTTARYLYVNPTTGSDETGSGESSAPFRTIQYVLDRIYAATPRITSPRSIIVTGAATVRERILIPAFESTLEPEYPEDCPFPITGAEYPINIVGDLEYGTKTALSVVSWSFDATTFLATVVVTGVTASADALVGRCLLGTGYQQMAWVMRNTATSGGQTTLYLSTWQELVEPLRLATPIDLKAPDGTEDVTIEGRGVRCGVSIQGLRVSHSHATLYRSLGFTDHGGTLAALGCDIAAGFLLNAVREPYFYGSLFQSQVTSGSPNANRSMVCQGFAKYFEECGFHRASFLDFPTAGTDGYYYCYFRICSDTGHGGGAYLAGGQFDMSECSFDGMAGTGSGACVNYNGGPPCSVDSCRFENIVHAVNAREFGGLRVKACVGSSGNTGYGIVVGDPTSPRLGGSGTVRISSATSVTGGLGDMLIGATVTSYTTLRGNTPKRATSSAYFATVWES